MAFVIGVLTFILVLDCLVLVLLVLIQLPKKDAGAGVAFGGAATDALFGAGSGNVLTKTTKYAAAGFFVLAILLRVLQYHYYHRDTSDFRRALEEQKQLPAAAQPAATPSATEPAPATTTPVTNLLLNVPPVSTPGTAATNTGAAPPK
jgi:preprotein translocase subunit SecG